MSGSRVALAGLTLATILLGYFPAPDPLSPVDPRPIPGPGQPDRGTWAGQPRPAANEGPLQGSDVELVEGGGDEASRAEDFRAFRACDSRRLPLATGPVGEAGSVVLTGHVQPNEVATGRLPQAELRLVRSLASRRESFGRESRRTHSALRQPYLEELICLAPLASLDELGKLVSYQRKRELDELQFAVAKQECSDCPPGLIVAVSYDSAPAAREKEPDRASCLPGMILPVSHDPAPAARREHWGAASCTDVPDSSGKDQAGMLPGLGAASRCGKAIGGWIGRQIRPRPPRVGSPIRTVTGSTAR